MGPISNLGQRNDEAVRRKTNHIAKLGVETQICCQAKTNGRIVQWDFGCLSVH